MTGERAKRFPLALADLVREPRKPGARADAARSEERGERCAQVRAAVPRAEARQASGRRGARAAAVRQARRGRCTAPERRLSRRGQHAAPVWPASPAPAAVKPVSAPAVKPAGGAAARPPNAPNQKEQGVALSGSSGARHTAVATSAAVRAPACPAVRLRRRRARTTQSAKAVPTSSAARAPNVALNTCARALTSERVRERMVERLRARTASPTSAC